MSTVPPASGGTPSTAQAGTTAAVKPTEPRNGGVVSNPDGKWDVWTGGKPKHDWSGLDNSAAKTFASPNQLRATSRYSQKGYNYRKNGTATKFGRDDDLAPFQDTVMEHLADTGMDSIAYLPDPKDTTKMISVVTSHSRFTIDSVRGHQGTFKPLFDEYDLMNDKAAKHFLIGSLSAEFGALIKKKAKDDDTFTVVWMLVLQSIQSTSIEVFERIKTRIKARHPSQYSGENLAKLGEDFLDDASLLESAGQYDHNLTLHMVKIFLEAGGEGKLAENYRHSIRILVERVHDELLKIRFMTKVDADDHMVKESLTYQAVCEKVESQYRRCKDQGEWLPSKNVRDSKAAPTQFGANLVEEKPLTRAEFMTLMQSGFAGASQNKPCFECGSTDHWKKDCPKLKNQQGRGQRNGRGSQPRSGGNGQNQRNGSQSKNWRYAAPGPRESETKKVNDKTFYWCGKCKRWTINHTTEQHTSKKPSTDSPAQANLSFVEDPSAWNIEFPTVDDLLAQMMVQVPMFLLAMILGGLCVFLASDPTWTWSYVLSFGTQSLHFMMQLWTYSAPILWFILCGLTIWQGQKRAIDDRSRRERRAESQHYRRQSRGSYKYASIADVNFHRKYPRRLREQARYHRRPPRVMERDMAQQMDHLHAATLRVLESVRTSGRNPLRPRREGVYQRSGRYGSCHACPSNVGSAYTNNVGCRVPRRQRRRPRAYSSNRHQYRPVSSASPKHGFGNGRWTQRQETAARKIATQVNMVCFDIKSPSNPAVLRMALQAPTRFRNAMPKESMFRVIWDSGASVSVSPHKSDFVGPYSKPPIAIKLKGLAKGLNIQGQGHVMWMIMDTSGMLRAIKVPAYHVPGCNIRLLSTSSLTQTYPGEKIVIEEGKLTLSGSPGQPTRGSVIALVDPTNNLPTSQAYRYGCADTPVKALQTTISEVSLANQNLTEPEKELLRWHYRLGHVGYRKIQSLMRSGVLSHSHATRSLHTAASKIQNPPKCAACQYGKQCRRPTPGKTSSVVRDREGVLKQDDLFAGQKIAVDHFVCSTKGRLFTSKGKTSEDEMYCGGCIYVDHATSYLHVEFQKHLNTHETLEAKEKFELMCRDHGVIPQAYHSDNGSSFTSKGFTAKLLEFAQVTSFAGAGAHHHNGTAERAIQTIMSMSRTMMLHAAIYWPDVADPTLWPMAVAHAVYLYNHMPSSDTGISPADMFTKTRWEQRKFHDVHVWGCPVYVLDKTLSDGKKLPRWKPRSRRASHMGNSAKHASTVPLVLNPETGAITAQFHVVFDDWFATVTSTGTGKDLPDLNSDDWKRMFGDSPTDSHIYEYDGLEPETTSHDSRSIHDSHSNRVARAMDASNPPMPLPVEAPPTSPPAVPFREHTPAAPSIPIALAPESSPASTPEARETSAPRVEQSPPTREMSQAREQSNQQQVSPRREISVEPPVRTMNQQQVPPFTPENPRRSSRSRKPIDRHGYDGTQGHGYLAMDTESAFEYLHTQYNSYGLWSPAVCKASVPDPDTLTFEEAMRDPEFRNQWKKAMEDEVKQLEDHGAWVEEPISDAKGKILPLTWVLRRKRTPDGEIKKLKARICVRGDLQEGVFDTFAPVVSWTSVRMFLVLTMMMEWETCSIDFSNAFVQAELKAPIWIHLPRGFHTAGQAKTCLRLKRSLYGISEAPRLWHEHLLKALLELGLKQCQHDQCLFYKANLLIVLYCDDAGLAAPEWKYIDEFIAALERKGFALTKEGSFSEFLGIKFTEDKQAGTITLTQKGLIKKIIAATNLEDCNPNWTPAATAALGMDPDGELMTEEWSYPSIVGMLLYLSTNTRPDIAYAVSQVARFNHSPKQSHARAVKQIVRYLARTWDKGTIVKPTNTLQLDCYVDADFAGLYNREPDSNLTSAKSRLGYIISLGGVPLVWRSQLQSEISLSSQESEYSSLSQSLRTLLPIRSLLIEVSEAIGIDETIRATIHARVFEDNTGAYSLATQQRITRRTRYYLVKWHHFWNAVNEGVVTIHRIETWRQAADYLTKGLSREVFERIRKINQGW